MTNPIAHDLREPPIMLPQPSALTKAPRVTIIRRDVGALSDSMSRLMKLLRRREALGRDVQAAAAARSAAAKCARDGDLAHAVELLQHELQRA